MLAQIEAIRGASRAAETSVIGADITVMGDINCEGDLRVFGAVVGDLHGRVLIIEPGAEVEGQIIALRAHICGEVTGAVTAIDVSMTRTARVVGNVTHSSLTLEPGAHHEGRRPWRPRGNMANLADNDS